MAKNWKWREWTEEDEEMSNLNLKGVWISIEILTDNKLSEKENATKPYLARIVFFLFTKNSQIILAKCIDKC